MKLVVSSLFLLLSSIEAFITTPLHSVPKTNLFASAAETDAFFRAVECAEGARATVDELDRLATDLEKDIGCKYEEGEDACQKEIQDRLDVAQLLRLRIELQLRTDYLKKENIFASDVHKSHNADERAKFREMLLANREKSNTDGSDLGLW